MDFEKIHSNNELRKIYNPEGSLLRKHQMRMLQMLKVVDNICKNNGIQYWLAGGTLIGAIRHGGFIPWDDDLDIEVPRQDYNRLLNILQEELPSNLALQDTSTDPNYFYCYAKIRDRESRISEVNEYDIFFQEQGIYIDVFPIEHHPQWIHVLSEKTIGHIYKIMKRKNESEVSKKSKVRFIASVNRCIIYPLLRCCSFSSKKYMNLGLGIPFRIRHLTEDVFPLKEMKFEDQFFPIPNNYDRFLRMIYGDYMQLPDLDRLQPHINKIEFFNSPAK